MPSELCPKVCEHFAMVHHSVCEFTEELKAKYRRNNYCTSANYLDFINRFIMLLRENRKRGVTQISRLISGM